MGPRGEEVAGYRDPRAENPKLYIITRQFIEDEPLALCADLCGDMMRNCSRLTSLPPSCHNLWWYGVFCRDPHCFGLLHGPCSNL